MLTVSNVFAKNRFPLSCSDGVGSVATIYDNAPSGYNPNGHNAQVEFTGPVLKQGLYSHCYPRTKECKGEQTANNRCVSVNAKMVNGEFGTAIGLEYERGPEYCELRWKDEKLLLKLGSSNSIYWVFDQGCKSK